MTADELSELLGQAADALRANKAHVTPELLTRITSIFEDVRGMSATLAVVLEVTPEQVGRLFEAGDKLLALERRLVTTDLTDRLVDALTGLRGRPIVLRLLAALMR